MKLKYIKPEIEVNKPSKSQNYSTECLDGDQLVHNGVPLPCGEPDPEEVQVHRYVQQCLKEKDGVHYLLAYHIIEEKIEVSG